jgi:hypothetical protein
METTNNRSDKLGELAKALAKAQSEMTAALKSSENPHFRSRYADLAAVFDACKEALNKNGFAIVQRVENDANGACVETMLLHSSGEFVSSKCWLPVAQKTAQAYGSAITYARRYGLTSLAGVAADEDDDGNAASEQSYQPQAARPAPAPSPAPVQPQPVPLSGPVIPFGKRKGQPIATLDEKSLAWYRAQAEAELADPAKAKFHASTAQWLNALAAEAQRRQDEF